MYIASSQLVDRLQLNMQRVIPTFNVERQFAEYELDINDSDVGDTPLHLATACGHIAVYSSPSPLLFSFSYMPLEK